MPPRILSISYDALLLSSRQQLLEQRGYSVISAEGFVRALQCCREGRFDLVVMGHSIPHSDKEALFKAVTEHCPVPVISLLRFGELPLNGAAASLDPLQPKEFVDTVDQLLAGKTE